MKLVKLLALTCTLACLASAAEAATLSGSPAMALAAIAAVHSPTLPADQKNAVAAFFAGRKPLYKGKIAIDADKIVCRTSNVDLTERSCELIYGGKTQTLTGREANEVYATEAMAGVPSDGAAGSIYESLSKLKCTLDPQAINQKDGSGAECSYEPPN